jgi:2-C-methyl-D-erythritol 2,4-cyclodiphosphate synthase
MRERHFTLGNADVTIVCESPKIAPHSDAMRANLAADIGCEVDRISARRRSSRIEPLIHDKQR